MKSPGGSFSGGFADFLGSIFNVRLPGGNGGKEGDRRGGKYDYDYEGLAQESLNGGGHHMQHQQLGRGLFNGFISSSRVVSERNKVALASSVNSTASRVSVYYDLSVFLHLSSLAIWCKVCHISSE